MGSETPFHQKLSSPYIPAYVRTEIVVLLSLPISGVTRIFRLRRILYVLGYPIINSISACSFPYFVRDIEHQSPSQSNTFAPTFRQTAAFCVFTDICAMMWTGLFTSRKLIGRMGEGWTWPMRLDVVIVDCPMVLSYFV